MRFNRNEKSNEYKIDCGVLDGMRIARLIDRLRISVRGTSHSLDSDRVQFTVRCGFSGICKLISVFAKESFNEPYLEFKEKRLVIN